MAGKVLHGLGKGAQGDGRALEHQLGGVGKIDAFQPVVFVIVNDIAVAYLLHDLLLVGQASLHVGFPGGGLDLLWAHAKQSAVDAGIWGDVKLHVKYLHNIKICISYVLYMYII